MDEIKALLEQWQSEGLVNPGGLEKAYEVISLLIQKVEDLENQINSK